jgi:hypothetical protein
MFSLSDLQRNLKLIVPVVIVLFIILVLTLLVFGLGRNEEYSYQGITPGKTDLAGVKKSLGNPLENYELNDGRLILVKYNIGKAEAKIYLRNDRVVLVKLRESKGLPQDFSEEEWVKVYSLDYAGFRIFLSPTKGKGFVLQETINTVFEEWFFEPKDLSQLKGDLSSINKLQEKKLELEEF